MKNLFIGIASLALAACAASPQAPGEAQYVKITPLGSHDGEFCPLGLDERKDVTDIGRVGHLVENDDLGLGKGRANILSDVRTDETGAASNHNFLHFVVLTRNQSSLPRRNDFFPGAVSRV